jgi:hypothetical protein
LLSDRLQRFLAYAIKNIRVQEINLTVSAISPLENRDALYFYHREHRAHGGKKITPRLRGENAPHRVACGLLANLLFHPGLSFPCFWKT